MKESGGVTWPGWEVIEAIGRGSFGTVYKIRRNVYGEIEEAALKIITIPHSEDDIKSLDKMLEKGVVAFPVANSWYSASSFYANGCTMFVEQGTDASAGIQFGGEAGCEAAEKLIELASNPGIVVDAEGSYGVSWLMEGTVDACFSGKWDYNSLLETHGVELGCAQLPMVTINGQETQLKSFANSTAIGVNPNSLYHEAAMELAVFLASVDSQACRLELTGATPAVTVLLDSPGVSGATAAEMSAMMHTSVAQPHIPEMSSFWGPMTTFSDNLMAGNMTKGNVKDYIDKMDTELNNGV